MTSLIRSLEYEISSVSPNYLLEEEEIWTISLWRNPVWLAGATLSTSTVKHFFTPSRGGPCQALASSAEEWPHRGSPGTTGAGEGQLQRGCETEVETISPGGTELCWRLGWFGLSRVNHPPPAAGYPAAPQLALRCSTLWGCSRASEPRHSDVPGDVLLPGRSSNTGCAVRENKLQELWAVISSVG